MMMKCFPLHVYSSSAEKMLSKIMTLGYFVFPWDIGREGFYRREDGEISCRIPTELDTVCEKLKYEGMMWHGEEGLEPWNCLYDIILRNPLDSYPPELVKKIVGIPLNPIDQEAFKHVVEDCKRRRILTSKETAMFLKRCDVED